MTPTETPAFRRWFGKSKVVGKDKQPLVVYHGTVGDFTAFDPAKAGSKAKTGSPHGSFFFSDRPDVAASYTVEWSGDFSERHYEGGVVLPVYLRIEKPLKVNAKGETWRDIEFKGQIVTTNDLAAYAQRHGYDGVIVSNVIDKGRGRVEGKAAATVYIALDPRQIKSATGNRGTFDLTDPDIRHNPATARRTHPALWERIVDEVTADDRGGLPGQWSARKAQLAVALYRQQGGGYIGPKSADNALAKWTREKWRTRSGRPSLVTGERYLPSKALAALSPQEYAATTRAKRAGMARGQQFVPQPERIAVKTAKYRNNPEYVPLRWEDGDEDDLDFEASGHLTDAVSAVLYGMEVTGQGKPSSSDVFSLWQREGVLPRARALYLHDVTVSPALRGRGAGRRYVAEVEADARRQGAEVVVLHADRSLGFWQKQGYTLWPQPPARHPEESAVMYKVLARANPARRNGFSMDDFNFFPTEAAPPRAPDYRAQGREALEARSGVQAPIFDVYSVLKEPEPEIDPAGYYTAPYMKGIREVAWAVAAPRASTAAQATAAGKRLIQKMIPRTKLASHLPLLVGCPLYVAYPGGVVRIEPAAKRNPAPARLAQRSPRLKWVTCDEASEFACAGEPQRGLEPYLVAELPNGERYDILRAADRSGFVLGHAFTSDLDEEYRVWNERGGWLEEVQSWTERSGKVVRAFAMGTKYKDVASAKHAAMRASSEGPTAQKFRHITSASSYYTSAKRNPAPVRLARRNPNYPNVSVYRGVLTSPEGRIRVKQIGKGQFSVAYLSEEPRPRVFLFTSGDVQDKEILMFAHDRLPNNPHLPAVEAYGDTRDGKTVWTMPLYKAPLKKADNETAWKQYLALKRCREALYKPRGVKSGYQVNYDVYECAVAAGVSPKLANALEHLISTAADYDEEYVFEFSPRNLATDDKGHLVLLDVLYHRRMLFRKLGAAAARGF